MYLSRLILDLRQPAVRRMVSDIYQLHRSVLAAFPAAPAGQSARAYFGILYRSETIAQRPMLVRLLVQAQHEPDWSTLAAHHLGPDLDERGNPAVRRIDEEYARITNGTALFFRLRANPTRKLPERLPGREDRLAGKRVALLREEEQLAWLGRKGEQHGFRLVATQLEPDIPAVQAARQANERGRRPAREGGQTMALTFGTTIFSGQLEVSDAERFRACLSQGIGSGKAFGFGLLSIASMGL
ncbi:type I-E CRISPR-associated protein Cas6/Cse3/CasE [Candidatus Viridilinea mediisalina]|uniref:Type I-E CRISPR-associated protein Cas6/Cse3/CasE n=1 Tax=Candidatus Viridilinea mediisalina TaxID=2024553 RepID=A0A2A6RF08_9CHLR|nr:type I-E CRISPR-associated protein Cas6/Cse3/CasE [Candidatus Viridilinea mediisalina]PDW01458.1 type I-E CRISPR-associated protein Cas6/Cse3/CasE [Candidatus Viridilinea mediisalina]